MWAGTLTTIRADGRTFRIGYNTPEAGEALARLLGPSLAEDAPAAAVLYSLELHPPATGRPQPLHALLADGCTFVRARDPMRVLRALAAHLALCDEIPGGRFLRIEGVAVTGERGTAVLPIDLRRSLAPLERRLGVTGLRLVDTPYVLVDPTTGDLVVPPAPEVAPSVLGDVELYRGEDAPGAAPPGRHRIQGWLLDELRGAPDRVRVALPLALNGGILGADKTRRVITKVQSRAALVSRWYPWPDDLVSAVVRLAEGRR